MSPSVYIFHYNMAMYGIEPTGTYGPNTTLISLRSSNARGYRCYGDIIINRSIYSLNIINVNEKDVKCSRKIRIIDSRNDSTTLIAHG